MEILNLSTNHLKEKGFENPRLNGERLLAYLLNIDRIELYLNFDRPFKDEELANFKTLLKRRLKHEPLQYILGETEFMSLPFKVDPRCLIPRPETEILVQAVIDECKKRYSELSELKILDIGTGSGNIAVSLAKYISNAHITAIDCSGDALKLAEQNAFLNDVSDRISWELLDASSNALENKFNQCFQIVVSNPPYVSENDFKQLPTDVKNFEPKNALLAGRTGLDFYLSIGSKLPHLLDREGFFAFEIGQGQGDDVVNICQQAGLQNLKRIPDLNGIERVVVGSN